MVSLLHLTGSNPHKSSETPSEPPSSKIRDLFIQKMDSNATSCVVNLTEEALFGVGLPQKEVKQFLPVFISEHPNKNQITLKILNQYASVIKYALTNGFVFQQMDDQSRACSILHYQNPHISTPKLANATGEIQSVAYTPKVQTSSDIIIKDHENDPKVPKPPILDTKFLTQNQLTVSEMRSRLLELNPKHTYEDLFGKKTWDLEHYNKENYPITVGTIDNRELFSLKRNGIGIRILDMPIYMPYQGLRIPPELKQFEEVFSKVLNCIKVINPDYEKDCYIYVTIDQGEVEPKKAQRRTGWHGDSYLKIDSNKKKVHVPFDEVYVCADECPTPFMPGPFTFKGVNPENVDEVLAHFAQESKDKIPVYYPNYTILKLNPFCVHNVGFNNSDKILSRTFIKISISKSKYCHLGNARGLFIYDWPMVPRHNVPYNKASLQQSSHRRDRDIFTEVQPRAVNFAEGFCEVPWAKPEIQKAIRIKEVMAEPAKEGEILQTLNDGFLSTILVADKGDWKVSASHNDQYFLNQAKIEKFYDQDPLNKSRFIPKPIPRLVVELTENIRFMSSWGTLQYAKKGDRLMYVDENDVYAVPKTLFDDEYKIIS